MAITNDKNQSRPASMRKAAEERLLTARAEAPPARTVEETQRLEHELDVHRIELELQNEELIQSQHEIEQALANYTDLYEFAPVGYFTLDRNGNILAVNLNGARLLGHDRSRLIGRRFGHYVVQHDRPAFTEFLHQVFTEQADGACDVALVTEGDTPFFVQLKAVLAASHEECRLIAFDITERKVIDDFQAFLAQTSPVSAISPFFEELARYLATSLKMDFVCIDRLEGDGLSARTVAVWCDGHFEDNVSYALKDTPCGDVVGKAVCCFPAGVSRLFPHDQVLRDMGAESYVGVTLWGHDGLPIGLIAVIGRRPLANRPLAENILKLAAFRASGELERLDAEEATARIQQALEELNLSLEERIVLTVEELRKKDQMLTLQERLSVMGEMINNIAHQWRQPLNTLGLVIQQLPIFYDSPAFNREFLVKNAAKAMELIQHMSQTIDDFRNFFRTDKEMVLFGVNQMIGQVISLVEQNFRDQRINITLATEGDPTISGYPNEYTQVILNIMMNARDALTENRAGQALISIRTFTEGDATVVTIADNAGGIADEIIDRIFEPYFSTKGPDKGTGIGLYMAKTIIEKNMDGRLTVANDRDGAVFRIEVSHGNR